MSDPLQALKAVSGGDIQSSSTDLPNIPAVPATDNSGLANFLSSVKNWLEKAAGSATGFATKQEMINAGVLTTNESGAIVPTLPVSVGVPPAPTGLVAAGAVETIIVSWDDPAAAYGNHAYAEVWAKGDSSFTGAVMVGQAASFMFAHVTGDSAQRWYWVRFVSTSGVKGPFSSVNGVPGSTGMDPAALFDAIAGSELATNPFFTITSAEVLAGTNVINGIALPVGTYIKDAFIADATISSAQIRSLVADKIAAGTISAAIVISAPTINGGTVNAGTVNGGSLNGVTGTFTGALVAATGTFGGALMAGVLDATELSGESHTYNVPNSVEGTYYSITVPAEKTTMRVTVLGGGGGGGNGASSTAPEVKSGGGGGGGAALPQTGTYTGLTPGATIYVRVGAGGAAAASGANSAVFNASMVAYLSSTGGTGGGTAPWGSGAPGAGGTSYGASGTGQATTGAGSVGGNGGVGGSSGYGAGGTAGAGVQWHSAGSGGAAGRGAGGGGGGGAYCVDYDGTLGWASGGPGGAGGNGLVLVEFYNPNSVVLQTDFGALKTKYNTLAAAMGRPDLQA